MIKPDAPIRNIIRQIFILRFLIIRKKCIEKIKVKKSEYKRGNLEWTIFHLKKQEL